MFVRCFAELDYPFEAVQRAALGNPRRWLDTIDGASDGKSFRCDVGPGERWQEARKQVQVRLDRPVLSPAKVIIPMTWTPSGLGGLFPTLIGSLEIALLRPETTLLSLMAEYKPPLGRVGRAVDNLLLHRVAWSTLREFTQSLATNLAAAVQLDQQVAEVLRKAPLVTATMRR